MDKLKELLNSNEIFIKPSDAAEVLGVDPQTIREKAKNNTLEFNFNRSGNRTKIFRVSFLEYIERSQSTCSH